MRRLTCKTMIIYEVNLNIDAQIDAEFNAWLNQHVRDMLKFSGFLKASILKEEIPQGSNQIKLSVQYQIENRAALEAYLMESAVNMREKGIQRFKNQFSASRHIFEVQAVVDSSSDL